MKKEDLEKYETGREYRFKASSRKNRLRATLIDKDAVFTGLSLYHGCAAVKIRTRRGAVYTLAAPCIEKIEK